MDLDLTVNDLVRNNRPVTLDAIGGLDRIGEEQAASPMFPYVVSALLAAWETLDPEQRRIAGNLITAAIAATPSGLALSDTCRVAVPAAVDLGITVEVKTSLADRIRRRDDQRSGALAAIALRWLAHLAVLADSARGAVVDALSEIGLRTREPPSFAAAAAQVAGVVYDRWRDPAATECLIRLTEISSDTDDAWFALGQTRLVDALDAADSDSCLAGLRSTIECFDYAATTGEQRPDAIMYANAVRFVTAWTADASREMLGDYYQHAHQALQDYMIRGFGLPGQPVWLRPRFEAETAWIVLVKTMQHVANPGPWDLRWYDATAAIGALVDVYRTANSFHPVRTDASPTAERLAGLVAPQLTAPFVKATERLGYMARWLEDVEDPEAEAFAELVRERAERVMPPKHLPPGGTQR